MTANWLPPGRRKPGESICPSGSTLSGPPREPEPIFTGLLYSIGPKSGIHFSENSDAITKR
jgi:hypothetical protein